jgi:hypothetical protein
MLLQILWLLASPVTARGMGESSCYSTNSSVGRMRQRLNQTFWFFTNPFTDYRRTQIVHSFTIASLYPCFLSGGVSNQT